MRINCCCCGRQIIKDSNISDEYCAPGIGAKAGFNQHSPFCGECAKDLDENGMFPEEHYKGE